ncbi:hypothetical protein BDA99DRAFT_521915 [Phascolomyces articulosus]|uniref:Uncharacterized protein n=1 Tax=Phascolomyces articulosus TaxID=60185 RepID=A0AAD5PA59_9FUNG|nr:hypothetical protein BDA99DRAFT_521915 [Phascolomyces articulosus]
MKRYQTKSIDDTIHTISSFFFTIIIFWVSSKKNEKVNGFAKIHGQMWGKNKVGSVFFMMVMMMMMCSVCVYNNV